MYRNAILEAAAHVFGAQGFEAAKISDIANEAGLASGTLYNYFDSKEEIFQSMLRARGAEMLDAVATSVAGAAGHEDALLRFVSTAFEFFERNRALLTLFLQLGAHAEWGIRHAIGEDAEERYLTFTALLGEHVAKASEAGVLRSDVPAADLVAMLTGTMNAFIHAWLVTEGDEDLAGRAHAVVRLFVEGAGA